MYIKEVTNFEVSVLLAFNRILFADIEQQTTVRQSLN